MPAACGLVNWSVERSLSKALYFLLPLRVATRPANFSIMPPWPGVLGGEFMYDALLVGAARGLASTLAHEAIQRWLIPWRQGR